MRISQEKRAKLSLIRVFLCAITTPVKSPRLAGHGETWPTARDIGDRLLELEASNHPGGLCSIAAPDYTLRWLEDGDA